MIYLYQPSIYKTSVVNGTTTIERNEEVPEPALMQVLRDYVWKDLTLWEDEHPQPSLRFSNTLRESEMAWWKCRTENLNKVRAFHYYKMLADDSIPQQLKDELIDSPITKYYMRDALP